MSERRRRNRNRDKSRESTRDQRFTIARKDDRPHNRGAFSVDKGEQAPKILMKPKRLEDSVPQSQSSHISIKARGREILQEPKQPTIVNEVKTPHEEPAVNSHASELVTLMPQFDNAYHFSSSALSYMSESNTHFLVVSAIGMQGVGKSTILNLLVNQKSRFKNRVQKIFKIRNGESFFSASPCTERVEMFVNNERLITIDCPPVLSNPLKKDCINSEMDDLKLLIFILSISHLVIVVQDEFNSSLIRMLQLAEMMKPHFENEDNGYYPHMLFVQNMVHRNCNQKPIHLDYPHIFQNSKLKIYKSDGKCTNKTEKRNVPAAKVIDSFEINSIEIPMFGDKTSEIRNISDDDIVNQLRKRVLMTPRNNISGKIGSQLTEKQWFGLAQKVWQSHSENFFLNRYETMKTKADPSHGTTSTT